MKRECTCAICGAKFIAGRKGALFCSKECRYQYQKVYNREWYHMHKKAVNERQNERRAEKRRCAKPDTIIAIGYAERQIANTLKMAGRVSTEL